MANLAITGGKGGHKSVPQPSKAKFLHGTWPPEPKMQQPTVKPQASSTRDYGKAPPLAGNTGMTGLS